MKWRLMALALGCFSVIPAKSEGIFGSRMRSYQNLRFDRVVKQKLDYSCGAAALATLLSYYWNYPVSEQVLLSDLHKKYVNQDREAVTNRGFSFSDLIDVSERHGFRGEGVQIDSSEILKTNAPMIIQVRDGLRWHFVVYLGKSAQRIHIADPVFGNMTLPFFEFEQVYTGYALAIWKPGAKIPPANTRFNLEPPSSEHRLTADWERGLSHSPTFPFR